MHRGYSSATALLSRVQEPIDLHAWEIYQIYDMIYRASTASSPDTGASVLSRVDVIRFGVLKNAIDEDTSLRVQNLEVNFVGLVWSSMVALRSGSKCHA